MPRSFITLLLGLVLVTAGCAASSAMPESPEPPEPGSGATPDEPDDPAVDDWPPLLVDWYSEFTLELPNGWTVRHCEGEATILCFADGDRHVGGVEIGDYALGENFDGDERGYLLAHAESFLDGLREDRNVGCPDFGFEAVPPVDVEVGGVRGIRAEFRLVDASGTEVERNVLYWAVHDGAHFVISATATDAESGCLERIGEFSPHDLGIALPYIERIVEQTPLPPAMHEPIHLP